MTIKIFELIIIILVVFTVTLLLINNLSQPYNDNFVKYDILKKFLASKVVMKHFTENERFTEDTCKLKEELLNMDNESYWNELRTLKIERPVSIRISNEDKEILLGYDINSDFIELKRVCYYNGSFYKIIVRAQ